MISFKTTPQMQLKLYVDPKAVAYEVAQGSERDIAEFLSEFAKFIVEGKIRHDADFQHKVAQYIEVITNTDDLNNIISYYGTLTDAIMYCRDFYTVIKEESK